MRLMLLNCYGFTHGQTSVRLLWLPVGYGVLFHLGYLTSVPSFLLSLHGGRNIMYIYKKRIQDESNSSMAATTVNPKVVLMRCC